jgi:hypothetical protein
MTVPACGQVHGDVAAAAPGGPCGDVDQVAADRGAAGFTAGQAGREGPRRQVSQRAIGPVREHLLDLGVVPLLLLGWSRVNGEWVNTAW